MTRRVVAILILVAGVAIGIGWWRGAASVPRDPEVLAELAKGRLRKKIPELRQALRGRFRDHHAPVLAALGATAIWLAARTADGAPPPTH